MLASDVIGRGMDFPSVDLVIQVGLPSSADQYVHRVGRTGRAGNVGRAIIMLTQRESFFINANRHLPIQPHAQTDKIVADAAACVPKVQRAMYAVDETVKQRAYSSYLGFFAGSGLLKPLRMDKTDLVKMANEVAVNGMYCPEPPAMEKKTVGKMGLKGIPGFNYATASDGSSISRNQQPRNQQSRAPPPRVQPARPAARRNSSGAQNVLSPITTGTGAIKKKPFRNGRRGKPTNANSAE